MEYSLLSVSCLSLVTDHLAGRVRNLEGAGAIPVHHARQVNGRPGAELTADLG